MDTTKIKNTAKLLAIWFPIAIVVFLLAGFVFSHLPEAKSEATQKIMEARQIQAEKDIELLQLKKEYEEHAKIVEAEQVTLTTITNKANDARNVQSAKETEITNLIEGKK